MAMEYSTYVMADGISREVEIGSKPIKGRFQISLTNNLIENGYLICIAKLNFPYD